MSSTWGGGKYGTFYMPKSRIQRKVEKPRYRQRYERRVGGRALYNLHGKLVGVRKALQPVQEALL